MSHTHLSHAHLNEYRHGHLFLGSAHERHERRTRYVVMLTAAMMVIEIGAGWLTGSMALLADGFHMATHAGALGIAAWAYGYARRHARDQRFTFGTGKVGDLAAFASALVLALVALGLCVESGQRLFVSTQIAYTEALWIAALGLAVNLASIWLLGDAPAHAGGAHQRQHDHGQHDHSHGHHGHQDHNLRSAYLHVMADALTSVLAIAALLAGRQFGWSWLDAATGMLGGLIIARWSWGLLRDTGAVLLDASSTTGLQEKIRKTMEDGDAQVTDLHVWRIGPGHYAAIVSLVAARPLAPRDYAARIAVHKELAHVTIEPHQCPGH